MSDGRIERVCILGVGLLGGSIARGLRQIDPAVRISGWGRSADRLAAAKDAGILCEAATDIADAAADADVVIAATPVQQIVSSLDAAARVASPDALLVDVGSTKQRIAAAAAPLPWVDRFCPSHPIAGSEKSGAQHADGSLLRGKVVVLTPTERTGEDTVRRARSLWESLGARTLWMSPAEHDAALAQTSHLPHLLAAALAGSTSAELLPLVGSGWADTTRVAGGDPVLWRQIAEENRADTLLAMRKFATIWAAWVDAMAADDFDAIERLLAQGKELRDAVGNRHPSGG